MNVCYNRASTLLLFITECSAKRSFPAETPTANITITLREMLKTEFLGNSRQLFLRFNGNG